MWFIFAGVQTVPIVWQLPQAFAVIGAAVWALAPVTGRPVAAVPLWQPEPVQSVDAPIPLWSILATGSQAVVAWHAEHCAVLVICPALAGVQLLPA